MRSADVPDVLPASPHEIDPAWLGDVLRRAEVLAPGERIEAMTAHELTEQAGVNGETFRLHLDTGGRQTSVVAKFASRSPAARGVAAYQGWYEREVRTYRELLTTSGVDAPACYFGELAADGSFLLLLEDLGGLRQGDQLAGCSDDEAEAIVRAAARLHARWWRDPALEALEWLPTTTVGLTRAGPVQGAFRGAWSSMEGEVALPAGLAQVMPRVIDAYPRLLEALAAPPATLAHGDYRLDNLFLERSERSTRVRPFDWQFACRCRGAYDVAYFAGLDLTVEQRRRIEDELLAAYLDALRDAGVEGYGIEELRRDYATGLALGFAVFVIGAAGSPREGRMWRVHEVGLQRLAAAILERDMAPLL